MAWLYVTRADGESVALTITDDGCGFDAQSAMDHRTRGLGLLIMQERLRAVDGSLRSSISTASPPWSSSPLPAA